MPTRRTRTASRRTTRRDAPQVVIGGRLGSVGHALVGRAVAAVLAGERRRAAISISFVGPDRIRRLNERWRGHDAPTDVLAFALPAPGWGPGALPIGDVYVCPAIARHQARALGVPLREELLRLVIHGTLHVLGYDHPAGPARARSTMWRKQERYLACVV